MFNRRHDDDPHALNEEAIHAHETALQRLGQIGAPSTAKCALSPGTDAIRVRRLGPEKMPTTYVGISTMQHGNSTGVALTPREARRIAMAILDAADEADGTSRLTFTVEGLDGKGGEE